MLDKGRLVEYEHPATLLKDENSAFAKLVRETGKSMTRQLTRMANKSKAALLQPIVDEGGASPVEEQREKREKKAKKHKKRLELKEEQPPGL